MIQRYRPHVFVNVEDHQPVAVMWPDEEGSHVPYDDHRAAVRELVEALREARHALQFANDSPGGPISDTIWMMHRPETLFDFLDAAIAKHQEGEG